MSWAYERCKVNGNPCKGVKRFTPGKRERYITDDEYNAVYECSSVVCKVAMEIAYLCAARKSDVLVLKRNELLEEGIYIKQGKTGKKQIKLWSPHLRAAIELSKTISSIGSMYVICNTKGSKIHGNTLHDHFNKARKLAADKFGIPTDFTFHDIKAKGISDYEGTMAEKQRFSDHKKMQQTNTYDRKPDLVPSLGSHKSD